MLRGKKMQSQNSKCITWKKIRLKRGLKNNGWENEGASGLKRAKNLSRIQSILIMGGNPF